MEQDDRLQISAEELHTLADNGLIDAQSYAYALKRIGHVPNSTRWRYWFNIALLVLGVGFLLAGIIFFFAYNWQALPKFGKLGLVQGLVVAAALVAFWRGLDDLIGQAALSAAAVLIGVVLAVYGQVYQTGADSYQLFLWWAILSAGWVAISRFMPLWLAWLGLVQVAVVATWAQRVNEQFAVMFLLLFALNAVALWQWELRLPTLRYGARILMLAALSVVLFPTLAFIAENFVVEDEPLLPLIPLVYLAFCAFCVWQYQRRRDLAILTAVGVSVIVVTLALLVQITDLDSGVALLLGGVLLIAESALLVRWLQRTTAGWEVTA